MDRIDNDDDGFNANDYGLMQRINYGYDLMV